MTYKTVANDLRKERDEAIKTNQELLEALKRIANMSYDVTIKDIARAAISKAEATK